MESVRVPGEQEESYTASLLPFVLLHVVAVAAVWWAGVTWQWVVFAIGFYYLRMFGITAGYHRYFSHRGYKTSRWFQFVLAYLGMISMQKGPLWWAAHHRDHHKYSDTPLDIHSPRRGFWWSHMIWILNHRFDATKYDRIKDFAKYPEIVWLNKHPYSVPTVSWIVASTLIGLGFGSVHIGLQAAAWLLLSTVVLWHGTFTINSFTHIWGRQRYDAGDDSRNSLFFALLTMGEGWHNNHHYYQSSANMGFFWWEVDLSYYALKVLSWFGLVWDLRTPPAHVLRGETKGGGSKLMNGEQAVPEQPADESVQLPVAARVAT